MEKIKGANRKLIQNAVDFTRGFMNLPENIELCFEDCPSVRFADENIAAEGEKNTMIKILFICHGNICRSTMSQCVLQHMVTKLGLEEQFYIDSMATSSEEIGNPPHRGTVKKLKEVGIPVIPHRAKQISQSDYNNFDYIIGMDEWNMRNLDRLLHGDIDGKVYKFLSFAGLDKDIADPWYTGNFDETYNDVTIGCEAFLKYLREKGEIN